MHKNNPAGVTSLPPNFSQAPSIHAYAMDIERTFFVVFVFHEALDGMQIPPYIYKPGYCSGTMYGP